MSTLLEIEAAIEALPHEQKEELARHLFAQLRSVPTSGHGAKLVAGPNGTLLLEAPAGAPPMTTETVRQMLEDFP